MIFVTIPPNENSSFSKPVQVKPLYFCWFCIGTYFRNHALLNIFMIIICSVRTCIGLVFAKKFHENLPTISVWKCLDDFRENEISWYFVNPTRGAFIFPLEASTGLTPISYQNLYSFNLSAKNPRCHEADPTHSLFLLCVSAGDKDKMLLGRRKLSLIHGLTNYCI